MPQERGKLSPENAEKYGYVPAAPVGRIIDRWAIPREDPMNNYNNGGDISPLVTLAAMTGIHKDTLYKTRVGKKDWLEFDNADKIITTIDPLLWHSDPELSRIYEEFNFSYLDLAHPTSPEADILHLFAGLPARVVGRAIGVTPNAVQYARRARGFNKRGFQGAAV